VIHAVGPVWHGGQRGEAELLASAYRSALELADSQGLTTIAFPAISTGIYGFPLRAATEIAVRTTREFLGRALNVREVTFACFSGEALEEYQRAGISA
jgi:O-acetyl-ADP-ribose deacetylase (regulator of RNase III)